MSPRPRSAHVLNVFESRPGNLAAKMADWGKTKDGTKVKSFELDNGNGLKMVAAEYGAVITQLNAPDRAGDQADIVLGFDSLAEYEADSPYFGVTVGRFANRIAHGKFSLDGKEYKLATNETPAGIPAHLHGGLKGFDKQVWSGRELDTPEGPSVEFTLTSPDGDEGYPGAVQITATYTLTYVGALRVEYRATSDKPTPINLAQHSYFNLAGHDQGDVLNQKVTIFADYFTPVGEDLIPTGELRSVVHTPLDFRRAKKIGRDIQKQFDQLQFAGGFDHNWVLRRPYGQFRPAARVVEPGSGRVLEVWTDSPGMQFYSGNFLDGKRKGKGGTIYPQRAGLCLETQHFPDSPNKPQFPSCILRPGEEYYAVTEYRLMVEL